MKENYYFDQFTPINKIRPKIAKTSEASIKVLEKLNFRARLVLLNSYGLLNFICNLCII